MYQEIQALLLPPKIKLIYRTNQLAFSINNSKPTMMACRSILIIGTDSTLSSSFCQSEILLARQLDKSIVHLRFLTYRPVPFLQQVHPQFVIEEEWSRLSSKQRHHLVTTQLLPALTFSKPSSSIWQQHRDQPVIEEEPAALTGKTVSANIPDWVIAQMPGTIEDLSVFAPDGELPLNLDAILLSEETANDWLSEAGGDFDLPEMGLEDTSVVETPTSLLAGYDESHDPWVEALAAEAAGTLDVAVEPDWYKQALAQAKELTEPKFTDEPPEVETLEPAVVEDPDPTAWYLNEVYVASIPEGADMPDWLRNSVSDDDTEGAISDWLRDQELGADTPEPSTPVMSWLDDVVEAEEPLSKPDTSMPFASPKASSDESLPQGREGMLPAWHPSQPQRQPVRPAPPPPAATIAPKVAAPPLPVRRVAQPVPPPPLPSVTRNLPSGDVTTGSESELSNVNLSTKTDIVQFAAYAPQMAEQEQRYSLIVYAHTASALSHVMQDVQKFRDEFGDIEPRQKHAKGSVEIAPRTEIEVIPLCEGITFSPETIKKPWVGDWIRFNFDFTVPNHYAEDELWIYISIQIKGIEIAHIKLSCEISASQTSPFSLAVDRLRRFSQPSVAKSNPLESAAQRANFSTAGPYRRIFISYSHRDQAVALSRADEIERVLGDKVFIDVKSLRAGEDWQYKIAEAIQICDIFHLLWSSNSAQSDYCRYEWSYALNHKCPENRCIGVIRPIFWEEPMPNPPEELQHLHFQKVTDV
ncbi:MAG: toll/interleukin-1 receptor domain-containing protein [Anaerolineales bacterium]|nr:toll/interleukin-1 receptor domain-containing protein [Anaerolineales bacterium]